MAGVIYHIENNKNGHYIGQYNNKNFLKYHWDNCWFRGGTAPWEREWLDDVKEKGMKDCGYIIRTHSEDEAKLIARLRKDLSPEWFNSFKAWWGFPDERQTAEALLICLLFKDKSITPLNSQVVGMSNVEFLSFTSGDIGPDDLQSKQDRVLEKYGLDFHLIRSLKFENYQKLPQQLQAEFDEITKNTAWKNGMKKFDIRKEPKIREFIATNLTNLIDEHYLNDLEKYINNRFPRNSKAYKVLEKVYSTLKSEKNTLSTRTELIEELNRMWEENKVLDVIQDYTKNKRLRAFGLKKIDFCRIYNEWYASHSWSSYLGNGAENTKEQLDSVHKAHKRYFTDLVQEAVFGNIYDDEFESYRQEQFDSDQANGIKHYLTYYRKKYNTERLGITNENYYTLKSVLRTRVEIVDNDYLRRNWNEIYPEQISIWMDSNEREVMLKDEEKRAYFKLSPIPSKEQKRYGISTITVYDIQYY